LSKGKGGWRLDNAELTQRLSEGTRKLLEPEKRVMELEKKKSQSLCGRE